MKYDVTDDVLPNTHRDIIGIDDAASYSSMRGHRNDHRDQIDDFGRHRRNYDDDKASRPGRPADRDGGRDRRSPPRRSDSRDRIKRTINYLFI